MKRATRSILWTAAILVAAPTCFAEPQTVALEHKPPRPKRNDDPFLTGAPFTFDQVLRLFGEDAIPLHRRQQAIQSRGVDFAWSSDKVDKLKAAGANTETLDLIKSRAKVAVVVPQAPPKPPPSGAVAIACAPAECDVILNGTPRGSTQGGTLELAQIPPGKLTIDFKKTGYIGTQSVVIVEADRTLPVSATLDPTHATQEALGADLFQKVVQAVGGADGVQQLSSTQASGSLSIWGTDGKAARWTLLMRNRPDRALFQARAGGGILHEVSFAGNEYRASKNLKGPDALELPTDLGFIRDYQLAALLTKLSDPQYKLLASHPLPAAGEEFSLYAEGASEKFSIALDSELRPQRVRITTATGVGSVLLIYGDYLKKEKAAYPKALQIKPDGRQQGIDVRFDTVELNPKLNDLDYKMKGKPLVKMED